MNFSINEGSLFIHKLDELLDNHADVEVVIAPTMLALQPLHLQVQHHHFNLAAQNFYWRDHGAYTGEVSAAQLRGLVSYALVGHSERRYVFGEHDRDLRNKVQAAFRNDITPVLCIGETAQEKADGETHDIIHDQLVNGLTNVTSEEAGRLVIAYEPVWAVGSAKTPTPGEIERVVKAIRSQVSHLFGKKIAEQVRVLYGGSVTLDSAATILGLEGIDGLLVGSASLNVREFAGIINKAHALNTQVAKKRKK